MAVQLDLSYKPRRPQGLRPKDYQLESLLEKGPQLKTKSASPFSDILAPPEDTSDETSIRSEKTDVSSDDSLSGVGKGKRESPTFRDTGKASKPTSPKEESGDLLYKEPSNIAAPIFTSSKVSQNRYGSQSSQKRKSAIKDEEEEDIFGMGMTSSQPKKVRKDYSVNVHKRSSVEEKKVTKPASRGSQRRKDEFHVPHTHALLAQGN